MPWNIVRRRLGRAGGQKARGARQRAWDRQYGEGQWDIGYVLDGAFVPQDVAYQTIYVKSYAAHFETHPEDLEELITIAKTLRNPHAEATTSVDLQVPAIMQYLQEHGLRLVGKEVVDIGTWDGECSHPISVRLSPLHVEVVGDRKMSLEKFWQRKKCLAIWEDDS